MAFIHPGVLQWPLEDSKFAMEVMYAKEVARCARCNTRAAIMCECDNRSFRNVGVLCICMCTCACAFIVYTCVCAAHTFRLISSRSLRAENITSFSYVKSPPLLVNEGVVLCARFCGFTKEMYDSTTVQMYESTTVQQFRPSAICADAR